VTILLIAFAVFLAVEDARPAFDVAVVKPDHAGTGVDRIRNVNGTLEIANVSLKRYLMMAYGIPESRDYLIVGPDWMDSENFDISARYPPAASRADSMSMLQRLLEEQFHVRLHRESREFRAYALTVAKNGPKLKAAADGQDSKCGGPRGGFKVQHGHAVGCGISMAGLADRLSRDPFGLNLPVVDKTGLAGAYDVALDFAEGKAVSRTVTRRFFNGWLEAAVGRAPGWLRNRSPQGMRS
jgi:uncharacterized protein (TIGR03435 family)